MSALESLDILDHIDNLYEKHGIRLSSSWSGWWIWREVRRTQSPEREFVSLHLDRTKYSWVTDHNELTKFPTLKEAAGMALAISYGYINEKENCNDQCYTR